MTTDDENAARWRAQYPLMAGALGIRPDHFENPIEHAFTEPEFDPWLDEQGQPILELDEIDISYDVAPMVISFRNGFGRLWYDVPSDRYLSIWTLDGVI